MTSVLGIELPDRWSAVPLKHVTSMVNRGTAPEYVDDGPVRMVSQAANQSGGLDWSRCRFHKFTGDARSLKGHLEPGDILVNSTGTGTLGRVGIFQRSPDNLPCVADGHVTVVRTVEDYDPRFLFYWLGSNPFSRYVYEALVVGATNQIELNREKLRDAKVPSPPLEEQRRIADFLDLETARIDALAASLGNQVNSSREHLLATIVAHTGRAEVNRNEVPDGWKILPIRRVALRVQTGGTPSSSGPDYWSDQLDGLPWYGPASFSDSISLGRPARWINKAAVAARVIPEFCADSVLIVGIGATAGKVAYLDHSATGNQQITAVTTNELMEGRYLAYQMFAAAAEVRDLAPYTTLPIINNEFIRSFEVAVPPRIVQKKLVMELDEVSTATANMVAKLRAMAKLLAERRQALIIAAITGQFDISTVSGRNATQGV